VSTVRHFLAPAGERLDRLVADALPELSRTQAKRLIEDGAVSVDGAVVARPAEAVNVGAAVDVVLPVVPNLDQLAEDVPLDVLYEDEHTLVINKQAGLLVHPVDGQAHVTLVNAVRARYPEVREIEGNRPGVVHRLDRDTSGVIAYAKSAAALVYLKEQWKRRETLKLYFALVEGHVEPPAGIVDAPLGADPENPRRRAVVAVGDTARSEYEVLEQYGAEAALARVRIYTGRTHQIRVHMEALGHPILGDRLYGHESALIKRQALHAWLLGFTLAATGEWREFEAPIPDDFIAAVETLRARHGVHASLNLSAPAEADGARPTRRPDKPGKYVSKEYV